MTTPPGWPPPPSRESADDELQRAEAAALFSRVADACFDMSQLARGIAARALRGDPLGSINLDVRALMDRAAVIGADMVDVAKRMLGREPPS